MAPDDTVEEGPEHVTHRITYLGPGNDVRDPVRRHTHRVGEPVDVSQAEADRLVNATPGETWQVEELSALAQEGDEN